MLALLPDDILCQVFAFLLGLNKSHISSSILLNRDRMKEKVRNNTKVFLLSKQFSTPLQSVIQQEALLVLSKHFAAFFSPLKGRCDYAIARLNRLTRTHNLAAENCNYKNSIYLEEEDILTSMLHADALFTFRKALTTRRIDTLLLFSIIYLDMLDLYELTLETLVDSLWIMRVSKYEQPDMVHWSLHHMRFLHYFIDTPPGWSPIYTMRRVENEYLQYMVANPSSTGECIKAQASGTTINVRDVVTFKKAHHVFCESVSMRRQGLIGLSTIHGVPCNRCFNLRRGRIVDWEPDEGEVTTCGVLVSYL